MGLDGVQAFDADPEVADTWFEMRLVMNGGLGWGDIGIFESFLRCKITSGGIENGKATYVVSHHDCPLMNDELERALHSIRSRRMDIEVIFN
ncbi:MAG: hypothetical protein AAB592_02860 [Patescibacteria group bacterium]